MTPRLRSFVCSQRRLKLPCPPGQVSSCRNLTSSCHLRAPSTKQNKYLQLTNRTLIRLVGVDAANFLHNIIPAKILGTGSTRPIYTAFLSAHGRILNDVFIYPPAEANGEEWYLEVDSESAGELLKHLRKHKLRAKFKLEKVDSQETGVFFAWPGCVKDLQVDGRLNEAGRTGGTDPRPGMGTRWLDVPESKSDFVTQLKDTGFTQTSLQDYTVHRMTHGFAEGQTELPTAGSLPQESNIDFFGGIDFFKGCYLGQELTIRTHHTGVVRKRILPVQLYQPNSKPPPDQALPEYLPNEDHSLPVPPPQSNISKLNARGRGRSSGKYLSGVGNIGLALCRLEMMTDIQLTAERTNYDPAGEYQVQWEISGGEEGQETEKREVFVRPFVPKWLRDGVEQSLRRKEKKARPKPVVAEEEEEGDEYEEVEEDDKSPQSAMHVR
ncbi:hypothetical protein B0A52_05428 [Exophiala mesophila]|uniref:Iron-sulfur cluster assembly factor IBA57 homolog, mitochondrial n=1 Tax=Exophiala mesophila TaxID=212818 RepID=A0A438N4W7_EXOME|nr:hypothetical protein B0A52_05428 [Exophiala mesophila]